MKNGMIVDDADGTTCWYLNDELHREDGPAQESADGDNFWYLNGEQHREDGPAEDWASGTNHWYIDGKLHREGGPASEWPDGTKHWHLNGIALIRPEGFKTMEEWFKHLNNNEEETYQLINDHNGFIGFIDNPSDRQKRLHQMRHVL